jgi:hypothetical protein
MRRLAPIALVLGLSPACGWLAGTSTPVDPTTGIPADPAAAADPNAPTCRPKEADARGAAPWKVGDVTASGWTVTEVASDNVEFARFTFTKDGTATQVEVAFNEAGAGDWATERYKLMPAPEATPPEALLTEAIAHLRTFAAAETGAPFVRRREGVQDPYEGLPPCP